MGFKESHCPHIYRASLRLGMFGLPLLLRRLNSLKIRECWNAPDSAMGYSPHANRTQILPMCFRHDFESVVLHAVNGGGQNQARAILTGSLVGAQVGLDRIPARFIEGLRDREELVSSAFKLASSDV
jgi:hypothetical protein